MFLQELSIINICGNITSSKKKDTAENIENNLYNKK